VSKAAATDAADPLRRGTPAGSLRFFSTLFAPKAARPILEALYAFEAVIRETVDSDSHEVAHTRMQWWRAEVDRYAGGRPQHPVTVALLGLREADSHDASLLHETLAAADLDLARMTYSTQQELEAYCYRAAGALQTLAAAALAGSRPLSDAEREFARRLGSALRQTEILRDFSIDLARGRLYLPLDAAEAAGIDPGDIRAATPDSLRRAIDPWRARLGHALAGLPALLAPYERTAQRPALVLAALHGRLLKRIAVEAQAAGERADVPPWSSLWTAWTTAVRYA
jgi:15-cis-phytoene synthase